MAAMVGSRSRSSTPETHMPYIKFNDFQDPCLDSTTDGSKTPSDQEHPASISNMKLVFGLLERGLPSLHRGYRTPDPSPTRTGLPKCSRFASSLGGAYQEFVEEDVNETQVPFTQRGRQPATKKDRSPSPSAPWLRLQTPSPEPAALPMPILPQEFIMQQVKPPVELRKTYWADMVDGGDETPTGEDDGSKTMQHPLCISFGSQGHPFSCGPACKYASKGSLSPLQVEEAGVNYHDPPSTQSWAESATAPCQEGIPVRRKRSRLSFPFGRKTCVPWG
ncbi:unnamed protein product [Durusdinium trenchii]|uniref:Uncharacterized protein n=1 Tax=Durusdinium trenchii TaxID=1381693 RepID=A0ABP0N310_9DINO